MYKRQDLDYVFVQVGGGGLAAGVAILLKQFMPEIKVIGVESKDSACLNAALEKGEPTDLAHVGLFADGVAVKRIGDETFRLCQKYLDGMVLVDSDEVCAAMKDLFENVRAIAEPSGALGLAGLKKYVKQNNLEGKNMAAILSGANLNFHTLRYVSERCEIGENREALLAVTMPEQPGSFLKDVYKRQVLGNLAYQAYQNYQKSQQNSQPNISENAFDVLNSSSHVDAGELILRTMIAAAAADGEITEDEKQTIANEAGNNPELAQ